MFLILTYLGKFLPIDIQFRRQSKSKLKEVQQCEENPLSNYNLNVEHLPANHLEYMSFVIEEIKYVDEF